MARIEPMPVATSDGVPILIRTTETADAVGIIELDQNVTSTSPFNVRKPEERPREEAQQVEWIKEHLEEPGYLALVAVAQTSIANQVIGGIAFKCMKPLRMRHHGHFGIGIHADWRGRGIGTHLVRTLIDWSRTHEFVERIDLGVFAGNHEAIALYRKLGFVEVGRREREFRFGPESYMDDVQMSLWVK